MHFKKYTDSAKLVDSQKLYDTVTGIQTGKVEDTLGWTVEVTPLEK